jgi:hypothetical protein
VVLGFLQFLAQLLRLRSAERLAQAGPDLGFLELDGPAGGLVIGWHDSTGWAA